MKLAIRPWTVLVTLPVGLALNAVRADDAGATLKADAATEHAAQIYSHLCQGCHMPKGEGAVGAGRYPALAGDPSLVSWKYVAIKVLQGGKGMPAFGLSGEEANHRMTVQLDDAEVADIVNYVRQHFGNHYKTTITAREIARLPHSAVEGEIDP